MYVQQRDEYLEHVCEMAIRKVSIITIFGTLTNSTMKIDHYQLGEHLKNCSFQFFTFLLSTVFWSNIDNFHLVPVFLCDFGRKKGIDTVFNYTYHTIQ